MIFLAILLAAQPTHLISKDVKPFTPAEKAQIRRALGDKLADASTAQLRWLPVSDWLVYCGWVNAKNQFGAYTGFRPYQITYHRDPKFEVVDIDIFSETGSNRGTETICKFGKYDLTVPPSQLPD